MAKDSNSKISIASLDKLLNELNIGPVVIPYSIEDEHIDIEVRRSVSLQEFCDMVDEAAGSYFQYDDAGQEHYVAGVGDFACDYVLLKHLTNLKTINDVKSENEDAKARQNERLHALCVHTNLVRLVENVLPKNLVLDYHNAVYEQVAFRKQQMLSQERKKLNEAVGQLEKATEAFVKFVELFRGIDPGTLMESAQKIAGMDEAALARAVVDARDKDFVAQRQDKIVEMPHVD